MVSRTHMRHIENYCIFRFDHESFNHLHSIPKQQNLGPKETRGEWRRGAVAPAERRVAPPSLQQVQSKLVRDLQGLQ